MKNIILGYFLIISATTLPTGGDGTYTYSIEAPIGTSPGDYSASIVYTYEGGAKTAAVSFNIKVIDFVPG